MLLLGFSPQSIFQPAQVISTLRELPASKQSIQLHTLSPRPTRLFTLFTLITLPLQLIPPTTTMSSSRGSSSREQKQQPKQQQQQETQFESDGEESDDQQ